MKAFVIHRRIEEEDIIDEMFLEKLKQFYQAKCKKGVCINPIEGSETTNFGLSNCHKILELLNQYTIDDVVDLLDKRETGPKITLYNLDTNEETEIVSLTQLIYERLYDTLNPNHHDYDGNITHTYVIETKNKSLTSLNQDEIDEIEYQKNSQYLRLDIDKIK